MLVCVLCSFQMVNQVGYRCDLNLSPSYNILTDALYNNCLSDIIRELPVHTNYVFEDEAHSILKNLKFDSLSLMSLNIQSLPSKNHEFCNLLNALNSNKSKVSCIGMQETWLTNLNNNSFSYHGYKSFFK